MGGHVGAPHFWLERHEQNAAGQEAAVLEVVESLVDPPARDELTDVRIELARVH